MAEECPTVREFLEHVANSKEKRMVVRFLSSKEYRILRDVVTAILAKDIYSSASLGGAPSQGVLSILEGKAMGILDKAIEAVERMVDIFHALQELPFKVSVSSTTFEVPGVVIRLDSETFAVQFCIPCEDRFRKTTNKTILDELYTVLEGLKGVKEKLGEIMEVLEKPAPEPLALMYARSIIEAIGS